MTLTVSRLRSWQPAQLEEAADSLEVSRRRLDFTVGDLSTAVRMLQDGWDGDAAVAAVGSMRTHVRTGTELVETINMVRRTLHATADALAAAQALLERARALAAEYYLIITDTGTVRPSPLYADPDREAQIVLGEVQAMVRQALAAADEADRDAAAAVRRAAFAAAAGGSTSDPEDVALVSAVSLRDVPTLGTDPRQVAGWWATLPEFAQTLMLLRHPELIGLLDGVPAWARDRANRAVLGGAIDDLTARLAELESSYHPFTGNLEYEGSYEDEHNALADRLRMLQVVQDQLGADPGYRLFLLETEMPGRAAIAIGNIDTADHIAVLVPGFSSAVTNYLPIIVGNADLVQNAAGEALWAAGDPANVATLAWIGYEAPLSADVLFDADAHRGADQLTATVNGIHNSRATTGADPHITIVGHSYGSLVAGHAIANQGALADDVVFIGSPGVGAQTAEGLGWSGDHVYVGSASGDVVGESGFFSRRPDSDYFGATQFQTDGGPHTAGGPATLAAEGHSQYYWANTESLWNISSVVSGHADAVTTVPSTLGGADQ